VSNGAVETLDPSSSCCSTEANGVNSAGVIVGTWDGLPMAWIPGTGVVSLSQNQGAAYAVNDAGQIVRYVRGPDGREHAMLWTLSAPAAPRSAHPVRRP